MNESLERSRQELIRLLKAYLLNKKVEITVVFDGKYPALGADGFGSHHSLRVVFSNQPFKADPLIKNLIEREEHPKGLFVVTDDSDIIESAKSYQVGTLSPVSFHSRLVKRRQDEDVYNKFGPNLTDKEVDDWLQIFGEK